MAFFRANALGKYEIKRIFVLECEGVGFNYAISVVNIGFFTKYMFWNRKRTKFAYENHLKVFFFNSCIMNLRARSGAQLCLIPFDLFKTTLHLRFSQVIWRKMSKQFPNNFNYNQICWHIYDCCTAPGCALLFA